MKTLKHKSITKLNGKIISSASLIGLNLLCTSSVSEAMIPTPNGAFRFFSRVSSSLGRFFRSSKSTSSNSTHKISKNFDKSNTNKSVLLTTFGTAEPTKPSKIKLTKFSDNLTGETSKTFLGAPTLHRPKKNRKNVYKINESSLISEFSSNSESSSPANSTPPTPRRGKQAVSPSPSFVIRSFEESLKRRNKEFDEMFKQNMKLKRQDFKGSREFLNNTRREVNLKFLGHSSKS